MGNVDVLTKIAAISENPPAECLRILSFLDDTPPEHLVFLTLKSLANGIGRDDLDGTAEAADFLADSRVGVLSRHAFLAFEDGEEHPIDDDELAAAYEDGYAVHPETGEEIRDFERCLSWYYSGRNLAA